MMVCLEISKDGEAVPPNLAALTKRYAWMSFVLTEDGQNVVDEAVEFARQLLSSHTALSCFVKSVVDERKTLYGYKNWWSYGHPKTLGQMNRGILGTCGNQYPTGIVRKRVIKLFLFLCGNEKLVDVTLLLAIACSLQRFSNPIFMARKKTIICAKK